MTFSPFVLEWFSGARSSNQLPISAVCDGRCLFCSNHLNPFPLLTGVFRDVEDIKLQLAAMPPTDSEIRLSDSLPGRISEGEAFLHPHFFEIVDLVRRRFFYNTLCFTTNGSMLDKDFVRRLAAYRPVQITLSMHSSDPATWARIFRLGEASARTAIAAPALLRRFGMELVGTIVPLPRLCGWDDIERTYSYLVSEGASAMIAYRPGHTVRTPVALRDDLACDDDEFAAFAARMRRRFEVPLDAYPDMAAKLSVAVDAIIEKTLRGNPHARGGPYAHVVWLSSAAAFARLHEMVETVSGGVGNDHHVMAAPNLTYAGNISAAGLLMAEDLVAAGSAALRAWPGTALFLVPAVAFDATRRDLSGVPAYSIAERLERPVWLVHDDGSVDPLLSVRLVERRAPVHRDLLDVMNAFNSGRADEAGLEMALDLIASYPLSTPIGPLTRDGLARLLRNERLGEPPAGTASRSFSMLDDATALCIERWRPVGAERGLTRWTRLVRRENGWRIASVEEGRGG